MMLMMLLRAFLLLRVVLGRIKSEERADDGNVDADGGPGGSGGNTYSSQSSIASK